MHHFIVIHMNRANQQPEDDDTYYTIMSLEFSPQGVGIGLCEEKIFENRRNLSKIKEDVNI